MLYVILGTDRIMSRSKFATLRDSLIAKRPDASVAVFDEDTCDVAALPSLAASAGLFSAKSLVVLDSVLGDEAIREAVVNILSDISASENVFMLYEEKVDAKTKKSLEKYAEHMDVYDAPKLAFRGVPVKRAAPVSEHARMCAAFSGFDLADAVASRDKKRAWMFVLQEHPRAVSSRDKKRAWMLLQHARMCDVGAEEIHGTIFWQVKMMLVCKDANSAEQAGVKPFVFGKSKRGANSFTTEELRMLSGNLVHAYHEAHRGGMPLYDALETLILRQV